MNLHCCEGTIVTGDFGMAIITLDNHYFMLSCQPTPPVPCPRRMRDMWTVEV
jgi:hypothetical protein